VRGGGGGGLLRAEREEDQGCRRAQRGASSVRRPREQMPAEEQVAKSGRGLRSR